MQISNVLTIIAIIIGPIAAVQIQKFIEKTKDKKNRKIYIFKTLMASRGSALSHSHVEALNRIDLEFSGERKYDKVIQAWKEYFDNLSQKVDDNQIPVWSSKNEELLVELLFEMGKSLGYKFDKLLIKRNIYSPIGHARIEQEQENLRRNLNEVLDGNRVIPMTLIQDEEQIKKQVELQKIMIDYYKSQTEKQE
ncbi:MAG: hypothetical protein PF487_06270 [Bacteroidales bacterium]|jgi:hypothetical protein|nr:hypothetical protein [Bacteroidales bacterium]